jgi:hypothetical protein
MHARDIGLIQVDFREESEMKVLIWMCSGEQTPSILAGSFWVAWSRRAFTIQDMSTGDVRVLAFLSI